MSDIVERLRETARTGTYGACSEACFVAADEITRLREAVAGARAIVEREGNRNDELNRLRDRIAHLERVQEAADAMRNKYVTPMPRSGLPESVQAYDAARKGEG